MIRKTKRSNSMIEQTIVAANSALKSSREILPIPGKAYSGSLLSIGSDAKTVKGEKQGVLTGIVYLAPHEIAWASHTVCPWATKACKLACLYSAGHGAFNSVQQARIDRTLAFWHNREGFIRQLISEIFVLTRKASRRGFKPAVRLNGTSDIAWEGIAPEIFASFPEVAFYDYTKGARRAFRTLPENYSLTVSRSDETTDAAVGELIGRGINVAVVFSTPKGSPLPDTWNGYPVIDGDLSDVRFYDPRGVIVGLRAKGQAHKDTSGFVVQL